MVIGSETECTAARDERVTDQDWNVNVRYEPPCFPSSLFVVGANRRFWHDMNEVGIAVIENAPRET